MKTPSSTPGVCVVSSFTAHGLLLAAFDAVWPPRPPGDVTVKTFPCHSRGQCGLHSPIIGRFLSSNRLRSIRWPDPGRAPWNLVPPER